MVNPIETRKVLSTLPYESPHRETLENIFSPAEVVHCGRDDDAGIRKALEDADVALIPGDVDDRYLMAPRLRWVHCDKAGIENSARPEVFERNLRVTCSAGRSAPALAEHALFFMLALAYRYPEFFQAQTHHQWGIPGQGELRALRGSTVGIVGMGHTARSLLTLLEALQMPTIIYRRSTAPVAHAGRVLSRDNGDDFSALLSQSDFIVLACSLNNDTHGMIGSEALGLMKADACLINIARGRLVNETALLAALREKRIAGAGLDTFGTEPLPPDSPIWEAPNTIITPHVTPALRDRTERSLRIISDNRDRFERGEPLCNCLTPADIYTPNGLESVV